MVERSREPIVPETRRLCPLRPGATAGVGRFSFDVYETRSHAGPRGLPVGGQVPGHELRRGPGGPEAERGVDLENLGAFEDLLVQRLTGGAMRNYFSLYEP